MYSKILDNRPTLYFQCVPPYTVADEASADRRQKLSHIGAELHEGSVYYYWWAFLRWNEAYLDCCENVGTGPMAALYADFGDVRDKSFWEWWISGGRLLFCEPPDEQIINCILPSHAPTDDNRVLLSIPITGDIDRTMAEIRKRIRPAFVRERKERQKAGISLKGHSRAKYQVHKTPVPEALYTRFKVWKAFRENPHASHFAIGDEAGIVERLDNPEKSADLINVVGATVGRYLRDAESLIYNVGEGRFPDTTRPPNLPKEGYRRRI